MVFHGDYEEALDNWESRSLPCPSNIRVGDLVRSKTKWIGGVGIVTDVYKMTHELSGESWWCCRVYIDGKERVLPIGDFELVRKAIS